MLTYAIIRHLFGCPCIEYKCQQNAHFPSFVTVMSSSARWADAPDSEVAEAFESLLFAALPGLVSMVAVPLPPAGATMPFYLEQSHFGIPLSLLGRLAGHYAAALTATLERPPPDDTAALLRVTQLLVLVNPRHALAWNTRKRLLRHGEETAEEDAVWGPAERHLTALALSGQPKAEAAWAHRRWTLTTAGPRGTALADWTAEWAVCEAAAVTHAYNYYAWRHRQWLLAHWPATQAVIEADLHATQRWRETSIADPCALHHTCVLLPQLLPPDAAADGWRVEWRSTVGLLLRFPAFDALWAHAVVAGHQMLWALAPGAREAVLEVMVAPLEALEAQATVPPARVADLRRQLAVMCAE